jgi:hypothetical protein
MRSIERLLKLDDFESPSYCRDSHLVLEYFFGRPIGSDDYSPWSNGAAAALAFCDERVVIRPEL